MTVSKKYTIWTSVFYTLFLLITPLLNNLLPGGPCGPAGILLVIFFAPYMCGLAFAFSLIFRLSGNKAFTGPTVINGLFLVASLVLLKALVL
jgi:hypothetical protein